MNQLLTMVRMKVPCVHIAEDAAPVSSDTRTELDIILTEDNFKVTGIPLSSPVRSPTEI